MTTQEQRHPAQTADGTAARTLPQHQDHGMGRRALAYTVP